MNKSLRLLIIVGCIMLILGAFYYGYIATMNKVVNQKPGQQPGTDINTVTADNDSAGEYASSMAFEDRLSPGAVLQKKILSLNTGKTIIEYDGKIPGELANAVESKVREHFKEYDSVEFSKDLVVVTKKMPYLPNRYVVKLEGQYVKAYKTDSEGNLANEVIEPYPCKNSDDELMKGIEVDSEEQIWETIGDYE